MSQLLTYTNTPAAERPHDAPVPAGLNDPTGKAPIDDFGDHIPGARKDMACWHLESGLHTDPGFKGTLTKCWPTPAWGKIAKEHADKGRPAGDLAWVRAVRDDLRTRHGRRLEQRISRDRPDGTTGLRGLALAVLENKLTPEEGQKYLDQLDPTHGRGCAERTVMYTQVGHANDLKGYYARHARDTGQWIIYGRWNGTFGSVTGDSMVEAARKLARALKECEPSADQDQKKTQHSPFSLRYRNENGNKTYGIWRRCAGRWVCARNYDNLNAARQALKDDIEELERWWKEWREVPATRRRENTARTPISINGTDDPEEFTSRYRFRGVQFGNWVEDRRRRTDLRDASNGLDDLGLALDWPAGALSLGGRLGLAFGARGKGGPRQVRAHYEPTQRVIAISKPAGPGTLAHEWFHALDNHTAMLSGITSTNYATNALQGIRKTLGTLANAMSAYGSALQTTPMHRRSVRLDMRRPRSNPYWSTTIEMAARAFEAWVVYRLVSMEIRNDYLVNFVDPSEWKGTPEMDQGYPYPYKDEMELIAPFAMAIADAGREIALAWADTAARNG